LTSSTPGRLRNFSITTTELEEIYIQNINHNPITFLKCLVTKHKMINNQRLVNKILETISKLTFVEKRRTITYKDIELYPSEIHLLLFVYHFQDKNITKIADRLGLTKGAISQTLSRLTKKGIILKETEPLKKNQLHIQFTNKGKILMKHVIKFRNALETQLINYLETKSGEEKLVISDFLDILVSIMHNNTH